MAKACEFEGVALDELALHSDNGAPMKSATLLARLVSLGVATSFSRPSVSNDNPVRAATPWIESIRDFSHRFLYRA